MATNGHRPAETRDRKKALIVGAIIAAVLVFGLGYLLGTGGDEQAAVSPTATTPAPTSETSSPTPTDKPSPTPSAIATPSPAATRSPTGGTSSSSPTSRVERKGRCSCSTTSRTS